MKPTKNKLRINPSSLYSTYGKEYDIITHLQKLGVQSR